MAKYRAEQNALINHAIQFATMAHGSQVRKGNEHIPYIFHPIDVANEVIYYSGLPIDQLAKAAVIGILHDVIEDTVVTYGDVVNQFGVEIADGVQALTKDGSVSKEDSLTENLVRLSQMPCYVQVVKLADRLSNLQTFPAMWDREKIAQYLDEGIQIAETLGHSSVTLKARLLMRVTENRIRLSLYQKSI